MTHHNQLTGLTDAQVAESRTLHGINILTPPKREPWWKLFLEKFSDPLIIILLVAGVLSIGIACYEYYGLGRDWKVFFEPMGIFMAIALATTLAFIFEQRANNAFRILNKVNDEELVEVIRSSTTVTIPRKDVVVGDIVIVSTGDEISADGELIDAVSLSVDESSLTGEPLCSKTIDPQYFDSEATYPSNHLLRGTKVMEGNGVIRVNKVGDDTEMGKVYVEAQIDSSVKTPLNIQLERLARWISNASYVVAGAVVVGLTVNYLVLGEWGSWTELLAHLLQTLMVAVTLIVVAVPEGLPMAVTLSLAYSMSRMLHTNNLVRRMHACETMGAATVICTDKTGTLTQNRMQVYSANFYDNPPQDIVYEGLAVNSTAQLHHEDGGRLQVVGNPTEGALLLWLNDNGIDYQALRQSTERIDQMPFTTERKYMATVVLSETGEKILYVKGAPEIVMRLCAIDDSTEAEVDAQLLKYQNQALRTLGLAYKVLTDDEAGIEDGTLTVRNLTFIGIVAIADPVRTDVPDAVEEVLNAGIKIKMVTGDTPGTAKEIARQIGLWSDAADTDRNIITGPEVAALTDAQLYDRVEELKIVARARPMDKKRLVEALQAHGEVVAVTGDGTNDAPALKAAQVGLSMGDGTSVSKEASDITIIDNSFSSIGRAVMWGRSLYKNIQRFLLFQLTVNVAACLLVLCGSLIGAESPLTVTQMLWVNLIMDTFGAMALASLPPSVDVMRDKPRRRSASILTPPMIKELFGVGILFFAITFGFYWVFIHADVISLTQILDVRIRGYESMTSYECTLLFSIFVWTHFWYMFVARTYDTHRSIFRTPLCKGFWTIVIIIVGGQLFITEVAYDFFNVSPMLHTPSWHFNPMGAIDLAIIIAASSMVLWVREVYSQFTKL